MDLRRPQLVEATLYAAPNSMELTAECTGMKEKTVHAVARHFSAHVAVLLRLCLKKSKHPSPADNCGP